MSDNTEVGEVSYKFISYPYRCEYGSSANRTIEHSIHDRDICLDDMLQEFQYFLTGCGYPLPIGSRIEVVNDE
jgi:hypothetical protein